MHLIKDLSEIEVTIAEVVEQCDRGNKFPGQDGVTEELLEELRDEMSEVLLRMNLIFEDWMITNAHFYKCICIVPSLMFVLSKSVEFIINVLDTWIKAPWTIYIFCNALLCSPLEFFRISKMFTRLTQLL